MVYTEDFSCMPCYNKSCYTPAGVAQLLEDHWEKWADTLMTEWCDSDWSNIIGRQKNSLRQRNACGGTYLKWASGPACGMEITAKRASDTCHQAYAADNGAYTAIALHISGKGGSVDDPFLWGCPSTLTS